MAAWRKDVYIGTSQSRYVTTSAIVVRFCASIRVRQPRPNIGDWECIFRDIRIDSSS
jgi:hypothetical protein